MALSAVIPTDNKVPGSYVRVSLGVGARSSGDAPRTLLFFGNKLTAGTAVIGTVYDVASEDDARTLTAAGSELFLMVKYALKANPGATIKIIAVTESAGAQAAGTLTVTGTATGPGTASIYVMGERIDVAIATGDVQNTIAANLEIAVDDMSDWPVTAGVATNVCTVTAKNRGPRGNTIGFRVECDAPGVAIAASGSGYLTAGATSDDPQTALDATAATRYHYLVAPYDDATNLAKFKNRVDASEEPEIGNREQVVACGFGAPGATTTIATGLNFPRVQLGWMEGNEQTPAVMAAVLAAARARAEGIDPAANLDGLQLVGLKASPRAADVPLASELKGALNNGYTPLVAGAGGVVGICRSITTKSLDASVQPDYRVLDTTKVTVCDAFADVLDLGFTDVFQQPGAGFKLAADSSTGDPPPPGVATPASILDWARATYRRYDGTAQGSIGQWFENVETYVPLVTCEIAASPAGRVLLSIPVDVIEGLHQGSIDLRQVA